MEPVKHSLVKWKYFWKNWVTLSTPLMLEKEGELRESDAACVFGIAGLQINHDKEQKCSNWERAFIQNVEVWENGLPCC